MLAPPAFSQPAASVPADTLRNTDVGEAVVAKRRGMVRGEHAGSIRWDMKRMKRLAHVLGSADPLRLAQLLPGVATNNDYTSGLHIQGCEAGHNRLLIDGLPVYNAAHLLGLFSSVTPSHFQTMHLKANAHPASAESTLGGILAFEPVDSIVERVHLNTTLSFMQSEGTLTLPLGSKATLRCSGRGSYLNALYGGLLETDDFGLRYGLKDYTATLSVRPNRRHRLSATFYAGHDRLKLHETSLQGAGRLGWGNRGGAVSWKQAAPKGINRELRLYYSHAYNRLNLAMTGITLRERSRANEAGVAEKWAWRASGRLALEGGLSATYYHFAPLQIDAQSAFIGNLERQPHERAGEAAAFVSSRWQPWRHTEVEAGVRWSALRGRRTFWGVDPRLTLRRNLGERTRLMFHYGHYRQNVRNVKLSSGGLPVDYYALTSLRPQTAHSFVLGASHTGRNRAFSLEVALYFKLLKHQAEFGGSIFDLATSPQSVNEALLKGDGRNYGLNVMLRRDAGRVTGWVSYAVGRAERRFAQLGGTRRFNAANDRRHDLAVVVDGRLTKRLSAGANFVYASGLPYTRAERIYIINTMPVCEYGSYNGANLPPVHRLDLSLTWQLGDLKKRTKHELNVSVYNVYARRNVLFRYFSTDKADFHSSVYSFCRCLPSVGYSLNF